MKCILTAVLFGLIFTTHAGAQTKTSKKTSTNKNVSKIQKTEFSSLLDVITNLYPGIKMPDFITVDGLLVSLSEGRKLNFEIDGYQGYIAKNKDGLIDYIMFQKKKCFSSGDYESGNSKFDALKRVLNQFASKHSATMEIKEKSQTTSGDSRYKSIDYGEKEFEYKCNGFKIIATVSYGGKFYDYDRLQDDYAGNINLVITNQW